MALDLANKIALPKDSFFVLFELTLFSCMCTTHGIKLHAGNFLQKEHAKRLRTRYITYLSFESNKALGQFEEIRNQLILIISNGSYIIPLSFLQLSKTFQTKSGERQ
jgi:hypothetical protein